MRTLMTQVRMLLMQVLMLFVVLMVLSLFSAVAHEVWSGQHSIQHWYLGFAGNLQLQQITL